MTPTPDRENTPLRGFFCASEFEPGRASSATGGSANRTKLGLRLQKENNIFSLTRREENNNLN